MNEMLQNFVSSITGNIPKAVLIVKNKEAKKEAKKNQEGQSPTAPEVQGAG